MKFSYKLFKKINSGIKSKEWLINKLTNTSFEAEDLGGDVLDISVLPNRFSDAGSHFGIIKDVLATEEKKFEPFKGGFSLKKTKEIEVNILEKGLCLRYMGVVMEIEKNEESPKWMQEILKDCGMKPINAVVDIMNYVMFLTGQPMHAFDFEKLAGEKIKKIIVRKAKVGEKMETLDNQKIDFDSETLVIADGEGPIAIAGIKGGKRAEVDGKTRKIVIEAANFDQVSIFKSTKRIGIQTDASLRFSHNLSAELTENGIREAVKLIKDILNGKEKEGEDIYLKKEKEKEVKFDFDKFRSFSGIDDLKIEKAEKILEFLGFKIKNKNKDGFLVEIPKIRKDIEIFEDLVEEVVRVYGVNNIKPKAPVISLWPTKENEEQIAKNKVRKILIGMGMDEIYSYSFSGEESLGELLNPISSERKYLRKGLEGFLKEAVLSNLRFFEEVRIFEMGRVFDGRGEILERMSLAGAMASKKENLFLELKGVLEEMLKKLGITDFYFKEKKEEAEIIAGKEYLGKIKEIKGNKSDVAVFEIDFEKLLKITEEEREYEEIVKYPSILRDLSFLVSNNVRVGDILRVIQGVDFEEIKDVDLIDFYEDDKLGNEMKSLTLRIVFQSPKRSLMDKDIDKIFDKIVKKMESEFGVEVR